MAACSLLTTAKKKQQHGIETHLQRLNLLVLLQASHKLQVGEVSRLSHNMEELNRISPTGKT